MRWLYSIYGKKVSVEEHMNLGLAEALSRLGVSPPLTVAEGSERREEEPGVKDSEANAGNADHPVTISTACLEGTGNT